jgi:DNA-binding transcriptional LysR family regulator
MTDDVQFAQLRAFAAVSRSQSYAVAAEELSYSAPAVYLQVKGLEKMLGLRLVRRQGKQVLLTTEGAQLLSTVIELLDRTDVVAQTARALSGHVMIGAGPNTAVSWIMPIVARYQTEFPDHNIEVDEGSAAELVRKVIEGRIDIAVGGINRSVVPPDEALMHRLVLVPWADDRWEVFGAAALAERIRRREVRAPLRVFYYRYWSSLNHAQVSDYLAGKLGVAVQLVDGSSLELVRGAIANELGLGIIPGSATLILDERRIVKVCSLGEYGSLRLRLLHRRPRLLGEPAQAFLRYLLRARPRALTRPRTGSSGLQS